MTSAWTAAGTAGVARSPRRVLWLVDSLKLGGAERLALAVAAAPPADWDLTVAALQPPPGGAGLERIWGAAALPPRTRLVQLGMRHLRDRAQFQRLEQLLRDLRPDLVHTHLRYATLWGAAAARRHGIPFVTTLHRLPAREADRRQRLLAWAERCAWRAAAHTIFVSHAQAQAWQARASGGWRARARVIPNGVGGVAPASQPVRRLHKRRRGIPEDGCLFLTIAVVRARKGWRTWLRAARAVVARRPQSYFIWLGTGEEQAELEAALAADNAGGRIRLIAAGGEVGGWLAAADVFVFPSEEEALPTAVLEAMGTGLPVIACALPAVLEVLGPCGQCVPVGDAPALARVAAAWAGTEAAGRRQQLGLAARARFERRFPHTVWCRELGQLYAATLAGPPTRRAPIVSTSQLPAGRAPRRTAPTARRLLMVEFFSRGGLWHYSRGLGEALARLGAARGLEVTVLTGWHPEAMGEAGALRIEARLPTWNPHWRSRWVPARLLRLWRGARYMAAWLEIVAYAQRRRPEVMLFGDFEHRCDDWFIAWLQRRGHRLAVIWHNVAAFDRYSQTALTRQPQWRRRLARRFEVVFVHGETLARQLWLECGVRAEVIAHAGPALPPPNGTVAALERELRLPAGPALALLFGTLTKYKGVGVLLEALSRLRPEERPLTLIAGMPAADVDLPQLRARAQTLGLDPWLRWQPEYVPSQRMGDYFRRADFVVLPYLAASQSGVAHWAMAAGKALIVSRTGALAELIDGNGLVVTPGDAGELAAAMRTLTADAALRQRLGRRSAQLVGERHDAGQIAARVLAVLAL